MDAGSPSHEPGSTHLRRTTPHPLPHRTRILSTGVFGPYAQDDLYGSRLINPVELFHEQMTRVQLRVQRRREARRYPLGLAVQPRDAAGLASASGADNARSTA